MLRYASVLLTAAVIITGSAMAEGTQECPPHAAQTLYTVLSAVENGDPVDGNEVYEFAEAGFRFCPENRDVQGLAALLFARLGQAAHDVDDKRLVFGRAFEAALRVDQVYGAGEALQVSNPDGSTAELYLYGPVFTALENVIMPGLVALAEDPVRRRVHPIFEAAPLPACPYVQNRSGGVEYEVDAIIDGGAPQDAEGYGLVLRRLEALRAACPDRAAYLVWALAAYNNQAVYQHGFRPDLAKAHARTALAHAAEFSRLDLKTAGDNEADRNLRRDYLSKMTVNLNARFPDL